VASGTERSYWACVFSVQYLLRGPEGYTLFDSEKAPKKCFLWTWTFADPEARYNVLEAARRWKGLADYLAKDGRKFVRSIEQGEKGAWHYHGVTGDLWDSGEMWKIAAKHGFGRVDVKEIPIEKAVYVAKYIRKRLQLPKGMRRWACVGFKGVTSSQVEITQKILHIIPNSCKDRLYGGIVWNIEGNGELFVALRSDYSLLPTYTMDIKATAQKLIVENSIKGFVAVGEYRGFAVKKVSVTDFKSNAKSQKCVVEHSVEINGSALKCAEWLPDGSDESSVKPPAAKGDSVLISIDSLSKKFGAGVLSIRPLASLL